RCLDNRPQHQATEVLPYGIEHRRIVALRWLPLKGEDVGQDIVDRTREDLRNGVHLITHLAEFEVIIGVAQAIRSAQRQTKFLRQIGEERLVVQVGLRLRDDRLYLIQLREHEKDRGQITEGFVQAAGLRRIAV